MKILNGGKKDYYDYLVGTYGIDEHVVYDRRDSIKIREFESGELYFIKRKLYEDSERKETIVYETENNKTKRLIKLIGKLYLKNYQLTKKNLNILFQLYHVDIIEVIFYLIILARFFMKLVKKFQIQYYQILSYHHL